MRVVIDNWVRLYGAKRKLKQDLMEELTFKNPAYYKMLHQIKVGKATHDQLPDQYLCLYEKEDGTLLIPRGTGKFLRNKLKEHRKIATWEDKRNKGEFMEFSVPFQGDFKHWEHYQTEMMDSMEKDKYGVWVCPTAGGKTLVAMGFMERVEKRTIIVVNRKFLLKQWVDAIEKHAQGGFSVGVWAGHKKKWGDVTVAMVQSLNNLTPQMRRKVRDYFGIMFVDEVHDASAPTFVTSVPIFNTYYTIGLTATPKRKDGKEFVYKRYIGPIREDIPDKVVEATGRIVPMKYQIIQTPYQLDYDDIEQDITLIGLALGTDYERTKFIVDEIVRDIAAGWKPIVFSNRVAHIKHFTKLFLKLGYKVGMIIGKTRDEQRDKFKEEMKNDELDLLTVNVQIAGQGIDIPILSSAHVTYFTSNETVLKQISGRVRRSYDGKKFGKIVFYKDYIYLIEKNLQSLKNQKREVKTFKDAYRKVEKKFKKWGFEEIESENYSLEH